MCAEVQETSPLHCSILYLCCASSKTPVSPRINEVSCCICHTMGKKKAREIKSRWEKGFSVKWSAVGLPNGLKERSDPIFVFHCYAAFSPRLALPPPLVPFFNLSHHFYTPCLPFILEGAISFPFLYVLSYLPVNDTPGASLFKVMITIFCSLLPRFNLNRLSETKVKLYLFYSTLFDLI